jgi:membrane protease YdiL (CAAX protease family)
MAVEPYLAKLKDAAKLTAYLVATLVAGALIAPALFWSARFVAGHGFFPFLNKYGFETFFHRSVLICAAVLLWPFLRLSGVRKLADLGLEPNPRWSRDIAAGAALSAAPLLVCSALLIAFQIYSFRHVIAWPRLGKTLAAAVTVPLIEETFFRGVMLGVLMRSGRRYLPVIAVSAIFAAIHFLKGQPERSAAIVTWTSGFASMMRVLGQSMEPAFLALTFATLFLLGCILADGRLLTRSLWLPIGLHAGWIFGAGLFGLVARQRVAVFPWLGRSLLVGLVPLGIGALTWVLMRVWLNHDRVSRV